MANNNDVDIDDVDDVVRQSSSMINSTNHLIIRYNTPYSSSSSILKNSGSIHISITTDDVDIIIVKCSGMTPSCCKDW